MMTSANRVFDKLKNLLGSQAPQEPQPESPPPRSSRASAAGQPPRRPARPRSPLSDPGLGTGAGRSRGPSGAFEPLEPPDESAPAEIPCPNCGEPMLSGWGTTCGKCRPNLVGAKTMFFAPG